MKQPRIAILHYSCPPVIGGVEFIIEAHYELLTERGYSTKLVVGDAGGGQPELCAEVIPEFASDGGPLRDVVARLDEGVVPPEFPAAVKTVEAKLREALRQVDVCIMHNVLTMHFNLVLTAALANIMECRPATRFIGWVHDATFADPAYSVHQRDEYPWNLLKQALPGCDYCVISAQRRREVRRIFRVPASRLPVIPDGIDVEQLLGLTPRVAALFREERLYKTDIVAITPTRIVRRKNLEMGMRIVAALKRQRKSVRWMITGAPDPHNADSVSYFEQLCELRGELRLEKEVIFLCERFKERVSGHDLRGLYGVSDVLLFPSWREGFGIPVLEAGITGLLVVASAIPSLKEIGGRDTVYIYPEERPETVAQRLLLAFEWSPRLVFRKSSIAEYSWEAVFNDKILPAVVSPETLWPASGQVRL